VILFVGSIGWECWFYHSYYCCVTVAQLAYVISSQFVIS
jgi:hypothetical protein